MKKTYLAFLILVIGLVVVSGCTQQQEPQKPPRGEQPSSGGESDSPDKQNLCGDKICDDFEKANNACPEDCGGKVPEMKQEKQPINQSNQGIQCDGVCDDFERVQKEKSGCYKPDCLGIREEPTLQNQSQAGPPQQQDTVTVEATGSTYKKVSSKPSTGWFKTGQNADIVLSAFDFDDTGGPLSFNHLGVAASDGQHLLVPDRFNNRVLIWNSLPTGNTEPDLVLGQKDFTTNTPGTGLDNLNWPVSVSVSPDGKLAVADTMNARILLWKTFPTRNGQPADIVLSGSQGGGAQKTDIAWPWGVWTDGKKLVVTSTRGATALIWNSFPTTNNQQPDYYLTAGDKFGTPRTITSDGKNLIVSDHNAKVSFDGQPAGEGGTSATFFWKTFPTSNTPPDFYMKGWMQGTMTKDKKIVLLGDKLYIWNSFPKDGNDQADLAVGKTGPTGPGFYFEGGDGAGVLETPDGKIYVSLYNGNKIVGYNSLPQKGDQKPDFVIGATNIDENTLKTNFLITNPQPATDGKSLFVVSDFDRKFYVWKNLPDESGAKPDFVYDFFGQLGNVNFQALGIAVGQDSVAIVGRGPNERPEVYIWTKLPLNGELPDRSFTGKIGSIQLQKASGIAIDEKYFYISDEIGGKIYVWEGVPKETDKPKFTLSTESPTVISSDGKYLVVNSIGVNPEISIYDVSAISSSSIPRGVGGVAKNSGRAFVFKGHLFTASTSNSQVRIWKDIETAITGSNPDVILGEDDLEDEIAEIGKNKLFWPYNLAFDGSFLWVGEVKFSTRLLRFSVS